MHPSGNGTEFRWNAVAQKNRTEFRCDAAVRERNRVPLGCSRLRTELSSVGMQPARGTEPSSVEMQSSGNGTEFRWAAVAQENRTEFRWNAVVQENGTEFR